MCQTLSLGNSLLTENCLLAHGKLRHLEIKNPTQGEQKGHDEAGRECLSVRVML